MSDQTNPYQSPMPLPPEASGFTPAIMDPGSGELTALFETRPVVFVSLAWMMVAFGVLALLSFAVFGFNFSRIALALGISFGITTVICCVMAWKATKAAVQISDAGFEIRGDHQTFLSWDTISTWSQVSPRSTITLVDLNGRAIEVNSPAMSPARNALAGVILRRRIPERFRGLP